MFYGISNEVCVYMRRHNTKYPQGGGNAAQSRLSNTIKPRRRNKADGVANANMSKEGDNKQKNSQICRKHMHVYKGH